MRTDYPTTDITTVKCINRNPFRSLTAVNMAKAAEKALKPQQSIK